MDLSEKCKQKILERLQECSFSKRKEKELKIDHQIMTKYINQKSNSFRRIVFNETSMGPQFWYYICTRGPFNAKTERLKKYCDEPLCYVHYYCLTKSNIKQKHDFSKLLPDDHLVAELYISQNTVIDPISGCQLWTGELEINGYGQGFVLGKPYRYMHRFVYQLRHRKTLPPDIYVRHHPILCKNKHCVAQDHLLEGTAQDNANDEKIAGKILYGEKNPNCKYSNAQIEEVKKLVKENKLTQSEIAKQTKTSVHTVGNIFRTGNRSTLRKRKREPKKRFFTPEQIRIIRQKYAQENFEIFQLGQEYKCSKTTISRIVKKLIYRDVQDTVEEQKKYDMQKEKAFLLEAQNRLKNGSLESENGCWTWLGYETLNGYGQIRFHSKTTQTHILSYMAGKNEGKPIPKGLVIRHHCNPPNRLCVNPAHLEIGTYSDNSLDAVKMNRLHKFPRKYDDTFQAKIVEQLKTKPVMDVVELSGLTYNQVMGIKSSQTKLAKKSATASSL